MSRFDCVDSVEPIEFFALQRAYRADNNHNKVDLIIGTYRSDEGKPWLLPVVHKVEQTLANTDGYNHEYLGQLGDNRFSESVTKLLLGNQCKAIAENRTFGVQTLSGTGALRVGADFLRHNCDSVILLHACAHNPTGMDPTAQQWTAIADVMAERKLFPFFDCAYQGFATGDADRDAYSVRYFVDRGFELICAQSFAKNFGLYNERVGNLTFVLNTTGACINRMREQLTISVRAMYSSPPAHGASVVTKVLNDPQLYDEWYGICYNKGCIRQMSGRINDMRAKLRQMLEGLGTPGKWTHITQQIGMFAYTGLTLPQVKHMRDFYHIYLPNDGRICVAGLNTNNIEYVAKAINETIAKFP
ncbi:unnamed protein product [Oppiella nova]|uniref:Aspartate aminotransferase n=1 Tax=Oppiella nova TaxID=334625 RepID=A0A7R9MC27_9ACAR|nr:unnamed protein product [Oppiella nova]CAG2174430.1 unnamed protein product [Oppiella nova]